MNPWFNTPERIAALRAAAQAWVGTPFSPNACTRGKGASCQKLAAAILRDAGFPIGDVPDGPMAHARFARESLAEPWLDTRPDFSRFDWLPTIALMPGDVLGLRLGRVIHHLGVVVEARAFIHSIEHLGTTICPVFDPTWSQRIGAVWRPLELHQTVD